MALILSLQGAINALLLADAGMITLIGDRLYQDLPEEPVFPYLTLGDSQEIDDSVEHLDASELFVDFHIWSRPADGDGYAEAKRIAAALRAALHNAEIDLSENRCVLIEHRITRSFKDADDITIHGVVTFRALTENVSSS